MKRELLDPAKYSNGKLGDMVAVLNKQKDSYRVLIYAHPKKELSKISSNARASMYRGVSKNGPSWQVRFIINYVQSQFINHSLNHRSKYSQRKIRSSSDRSNASTLLLGYMISALYLQKVSMPRLTSATTRGSFYVSSNTVTMYARAISQTERSVARHNCLSLIWHTWFDSLTFDMTYWWRTSRSLYQNELRASEQFELWSLVTKHFKLNLLIYDFNIKTLQKHYNY